MEPAYLAVARVRKPHGLKGEGLVVALTDDPETVFVQGRQLTPLHEDGAPAGAAAVVFRARHYHGRQWLLSFEGVGDRAAIESWRDRLLGAAQADLTPLRDGQMYEHEIAGCRVVANGAVIGTATGLIDVPQGRLLAVAIGKAGEEGVGGGETQEGSEAGKRSGRELLIPFRPPIVVSLDREQRRIEIAPPPGLLEL